MLSTPDHAICRILFAGIGRKPLRQEAGLASSFRVLESAQGVVIPSGMGMPEDVKRFVLLTLAKEMDVGPAQMPEDVSLAHVGVDSIAAVGLCNRLKSVFGITLPLAEVLGGKTANELSELVAELLKLPKSSTVDDIPVGPRNRN